MDLSMEHTIFWYVGAEAMELYSAPSSTFSTISLLDLILGGAISPIDEEILRHYKYAIPKISKIFIMIHNVRKLNKIQCVAQGNGFVYNKLVHCDTRRVYSLHGMDVLQGGCTEGKYYNGTINNSSAR